MRVSVAIKLPTEFLVDFCEERRPSGRPEDDDTILPLCLFDSLTSPVIGTNTAIATGAIQRHKKYAVNSRQFFRPPPPASLGVLGNPPTATHFNLFCLARTLRLCVLFVPRVIYHHCRCGLLPLEPFVSGQNRVSPCDRYHYPECYGRPRHLHWRSEQRSVAGPDCNNDHGLYYYDGNKHE